MNIRRSDWRYGAAAATIALSLVGCTATQDATTQSSDEAAAVAGESVQTGLAAVPGLLGAFGASDRGQHGPPGGGPPEFLANLTDEQRETLRTLHEQFRSGEITRDEFAAQFQQITGQALPARGPGGPLEHLSELLSLSEEQKTAARAIFDAAHDDIRALHEAARAEIRDLLTAEQQAIFDELPPPGGRGGPMGGGPGGPLGSGARARGMVDGELGPPPDAAGDRPPGPPDLSELLSLTEEQQTAIAAIRATTRDAVQARREQARTEFRTLLSAEQTAALDGFEAERPDGPPGS